jgi:hypothetical protein
LSTLVAIINVLATEFAASVEFASAMTTGAWGFPVIQEIALREYALSNSLGWTNPMKLDYTTNMLSAPHVEFARETVENANASLDTRVKHARELVALMNVLVTVNALTSRTCLSTLLTMTLPIEILRDIFTKLRLRLTCTTDGMR